MRSALLSSVSFVFITLASVCLPGTAQAGFEFVPAPAAAPAKAAPVQSSPVPAVDNTPVAAEVLENVPYVDEKATLPAAPVQVPADAPVADVPVAKAEPKADPSEPMVLGRKAIPLTPVVRESDALVMDDAPRIMPVPMMAPLENTAMSDATAETPMDIMPAPKRVPLASTSTKASVNTNDVLWDSPVENNVADMNASDSVKAETISSDLPPALPPAVSSSMPESMASSMGLGLATDVPNIASEDIHDGAPVQGFGRQVPLAMALQQVVPSNYRYSFGTGVDPGMRVSWTGGKTWKTIVTDLARDNALNVDIASDVVAFRRRTPMDILSSDVDMSADTVQGMTLKPLPQDPINDPIVLPMIDSAQMPPMSAAEPKTVTAQRQEAAALQGEKSKIRKAKFDTMLGTDTPAQAFVKDKRILTADEADEDDASVQMAAVTAATATIDAPAAAPIAEKKIATTEEIIFDEPTKNTANDAAIKNTTDTAAPMNIMPTAGMKKDPLFDQNMDAEKPSDKPVIQKEIAVMDDEASVNESVADQQIAALPPAMPAQDSWMKPLPSDDQIAAAPELSARVSESVPADLTTSREWEAFKNQTLRETLTSWSQIAGVSVVWSSEYDYPLQTDVRIAANYGDAVRTLLAGFSKAQPRPVGRLFKNDKVGAQPVIVVETQRLTN